MPPNVRFPVPKMARGKSLLGLSNARRDEKARRRETEEAAGPSQKSLESKLTVSFQASGSEDAANEPPLKEAPARPRVPKTRGLSSLRLLKSKVAPTSTATSASPRSSPGTSGAKHSGALSPAGTSPGSSSGAGAAARLERRASSSLMSGASSSLDAALVGVRAYLSLRRAARVAAHEPEPEPPASVAAAVLAMQPANEQWAQRHAALLALPSLVAAAPTAGECKRRLDALCESLPTQLADLRSQLVRGACSVLCELCVAHGAAAAALVAASLPQLLLNQLLLKAFSVPSAAAARTVVGLAASAAAFRLLVEKTKDTRKQVRSGSFDLLAEILRKGGGFEVSSKALAAALAAIGRSGGGVADPDSGTRTAAAHCFWAAHARCPGGEAEAFLSGLGGKESKLVLRLRPKAPPPPPPPSPPRAAAEPPEPLTLSGGGAKVAPLNSSYFPTGSSAREVTSQLAPLRAEAGREPGVTELE